MAIANHVKSAVLKGRKVYHFEPRNAQVFYNYGGLVLSDPLLLDEELYNGNSEPISIQRHEDKGRS